jgi:hypothetical protein
MPIIRRALIHHRTLRTRTGRLTDKHIGNKEVTD